MESQSAQTRSNQRKRPLFGVSEVFTSNIQNVFTLENAYTSLNEKMRVQSENAPLHFETCKRPKHYQIGEKDL